MANIDAIPNRGTLGAALGTAIGALLGLTDAIGLGIDKSELMQNLHAAWGVLDPERPASLADVPASYPSLGALRAGLDALFQIHDFRDAGVGINVSQTILQLAAAIQKLEGEGAKHALYPGQGPQGFKVRLPLRPS